jgi:hypothetical protein
VKVGKAATLTVTVPPSSAGTGLAASHPAIRLVVTYTPKLGVARKLTVSGVRIL